jgi:hypothetical protein
MLMCDCPFQPTQDSLRLSKQEPSAKLQQAKEVSTCERAPSSANSPEQLEECILTTRKTAAVMLFCPPFLHAGTTTATLAAARAPADAAAGAGVAGAAVAAGGTLLLFLVHRFTEGASALLVRWVYQSMNVRGWQVVMLFLKSFPLAFFFNRPS